MRIMNVWRDGLPPGTIVAGKMSESALIRFTNKYIIDPNTGCWLWTSVIGDKGYGQFKIGLLTQGAHIFSYEHYVGLVPDGLELDHIVCDTRPCCNYAHLMAVTHLENIRRSNNFCRRKTHCKNGHEFTTENTVVNERNWRACRACRRAIDQQNYEHHKSARKLARQARQNRAPQ